MSANPPKNDAWPEPRHWLHVWVHRQRRNYPPSMPGLVLKWELRKGRWRAWVIWVDTTYERPEIRMDWLSIEEIRPAKSSINVWNDRYR